MYKIIYVLLVVCLVYFHIEHQVNIFLLAVMYYFSINILSYLYFYQDKQRAINNQYRTPNAVLRGTLLLGGTLGGICAMKKFRHKTRQLDYKIAVYASFFVHFFIVLALLYVFFKNHNLLPDALILYVDSLVDSIVPYLL